MSKVFYVRCPPKWTGLTLKYNCQVIKYAACKYSKLGHVPVLALPLGNADLYVIENQILMYIATLIIFMAKLHSKQMSSS